MATIVFEIQVSKNNDYSPQLKSCVSQINAMIADTVENSSSGKGSVKFKLKGGEKLPHALLAQFLGQLLNTFQCKGFKTFFWRTGIEVYGVTVSWDRTPIVTRAKRVITKLINCYAPHHEDRKQAA